MIRIGAHEIRWIGPIPYLPAEHIRASCAPYEFVEGRLYGDTTVFQNKMSTWHLVVPREVVKAIEMWEAAETYGGMPLADFLSRTLGDYASEITA